MISKFGSMFDLFKKQINLGFASNDSHTTQVGVIFSIIIYLSFLAGIYFFGREIIQKKQPDVSSSTFRLDDPPFLNMTAQNFPILFGLTDWTDWSQWVDEQIYHVEGTMQEAINYYDEQGQQQTNWTFTPFKPEICNFEQNFKMPSLNEKWSQVDYSRMYCLPPSTSNLSIGVQGDFDTGVQYRIIFIDIKECKNETLAEGAPPCKSPEEISAQLDNGYLTMYFPDITLDPKNHLKPTQQYVRIFYTTISKLMNPQYVELEFMETVITDDDGLVFREQRNSSSFGLGDSRQMPFFDSDQIVSISLAAHQKQNIVNRKYKQVQNVFAELGGFFQMIIVLAAIFIHPLRETDYQSKLLMLFYKIQFLHFKIPTPPPGVDNKNWDVDEEIEKIIEQDHKKEIQQIKVKLLKDYAEKAEELQAVSQHLSSREKQKTEKFSVLDKEKSMSKFKEQITRKIQTISQRRRNSNLPPWDENLCAQSAAVVIPSEIEKDPQNDEKQEESDMTPHNGSQISPNSISPLNINSSNRSNMILFLPQNNDSSDARSINLFNSQRNGQSVTPPQIMVNQKKQFFSKTEEIHARLRKSIFESNQAKVGGIQQQLTIRSLIKRKQTREEKQNQKVPNPFDELNYTDKFQLMFPFVLKDHQKKKIQTMKNQIKRKIDIRFILRKFIEIEKLQYILLNENQRKIFQFNPRTKVHVELEAQSDVRELDNTNNKFYKQLFLPEMDEGELRRDAFQAFCSLQLADQPVGDVDRKLMETLDDDSYMVFTDAIEEIQAAMEADEFEVQEEMPQHQKVSKQMKSQHSPMPQTREQEKQQRGETTPQKSAFSVNSKFDPSQMQNDALLQAPDSGLGFNTLVNQDKHEKYLLYPEEVSFSQLGGSHNMELENMNNIQDSVEK